jgi:deoxyribodipyrimidine photo-lyase
VGLTGTSTGNGVTRYRTALCWFRRDLRCYDNAALFYALKHSEGVVCAFVFDTDILDGLENREDRRVEFILKSIVELRAELEKLGGGLIVRHGPARQEIVRLACELGVDAVYANEDYEPFAIARDDAVASALSGCGIELRLFKDQVIFAKDEVLSQSGAPFTAYAQYKNAWLRKLQPFHLHSYPVPKYQAQLRPPPAAAPMPTLEDLGFRPTNLAQLRVLTGMSGGRRLFMDFLRRIKFYRERRDFPAIKGVSYLSVHFRFGTLSIREAAGIAYSLGNRGADAWLSELIWREFFFNVLYHFPHVVGHPFRREYEALKFDDREDRFAAWREGRTGYPLIDAAMRQINATGYMHNRLRMLTASFLVKDLHIDWRRGETYFADQLIDYDLAVNNGGWQWAASTGCDAQPYFRIFNPVTQSKKFDPEGRFIRRYVPELAGCDARAIHEPWKMSVFEQTSAGVVIGRDYPAPIVDHAAERQVALTRYSTLGPAAANSA